MSKILFEPAGKIHLPQYELIDNPPEGYEFILPKETFVDKHIVDYHDNINSNIFLEWVIYSLIPNTSKSLPFSQDVFGIGKRSVPSPATHCIYPE